jgi:anion-transporting  ArsA/GET3 family ATPase
VLLAELGDGASDGDRVTHDYSPLARLFGRERMPEKREQLLPGVWGKVLHPLEGHELFLTSVFRVHALARAALHSEALRRLFQAAPSLREVGIFYCILTLLRAKEADGSFENELIVIDMPATGHTLSLTGLPRVLISMVSRGPIADSLREGQSYLNDPEQSAAFVVTLPEALPVSETIELVEGLKSSAMPVGGVILNHVPADPFTPEEREAFSALLKKSRAEGTDWLGSGSFGYYERARREAARLEREVSVPLIRLPDAPPGCESLVSFLADSLIALSAIREGAR